MTHKVITTQLPAESTCREYIKRVDFQDAYKATLSDANISIENIYLNVFAHSPKWISHLLSLRNRIVGIFGLDNYKDAPEVTRETLKVGLKTGIFKIYAINEHEIIAGENDSHLNFRVSVLKQDNEVIISTLVHYNNWFGKLYMSLIMPFHKVVVKSMLKNAIKNKRI